jgi:hypothetical protein
MRRHSQVAAGLEGVTQRAQSHAMAAAAGAEGPVEVAGVEAEGAAAAAAAAAAVTAAAVTAAAAAAAAAAVAVASSGKSEPSQMPLRSTKFRVAALCLSGCLACPSGLLRRAKPNSACGGCPAVLRLV